MVTLKIKYNSAKVDRSKAELKPPQPGIYPMKVAEVKHYPATSEKEAYLEIISRLTAPDKNGDGKGWGFWDRITLNEDSAWKLDQYLVAMGRDTIAKPEGDLVLKDLLNLEFRGRVKTGTWNNEYSPKLGSVYPMEGGDAEDENADLFAETGGKKKKKDKEGKKDKGEKEGKGKKDKSEPAEEPAAEEPAKSEKKDKKKGKKKDYDDMDEDELKSECETRGLKSKGGKTAMIARLRTNDDDPFAD